MPFRVVAGSTRKGIERRIAGQIDG
jgi:hypothetical protein